MDADTKRQKRVFVSRLDEVVDRVLELIESTPSDMTIIVHCYTWGVAHYIIDRVKQEIDPEDIEGYRAGLLRIKDGPTVWYGGRSYDFEGITVGPGWPRRPRVMSDQ